MYCAMQRLIHIVEILELVIGHVCVVYISTNAPPSSSYITIFLQCRSPAAPAALSLVHRGDWEGGEERPRVGVGGLCKEEKYNNNSESTTSMK